MKNLTLSADEKLIAEGRRYARAHGTSLNQLIRDLLKRTVREERTHWADECLLKMDAARGRSAGQAWNREEVYDG